MWKVSIDGCMTPWVTVGLMSCQALYEGVRNLLYGKWGTTFQVINFVVYPSLARVCLGLQKCVQLDDGKRKPFIDLDESCGSGNYSMYSGLTGFLAGSYLVGYPMVSVPRRGRRISDSPDGTPHARW